MGVSQRVKSKYVFRLPISFLKAKRMNVKGKDTDAGEDLDEGLYASVPRTVRVQYESDVESEIEFDGGVDLVGISTSASAATRKRKRLVSWDGVKDQASSRWTMEQEEQLVHARAELARCQKAWSSEQEIWLKCIEELSEEKEAHEGFLNNRAKHIGDEQNHFRKAWDRNRRRSEQGQPHEQPQRLTPGQRTASLPVRLGKLKGRN